MSSLSLISFLARLHCARTRPSPFLSKEKFVRLLSFSAKVAWRFVVNLAAAKNRNRRFRKKRRPQAFGSSNSETKRTPWLSKRRTCMEDISTRANIIFSKHFISFCPRLYSSTLIHDHLSSHVFPRHDQAYHLSRRIYYHYYCIFIQIPLAHLCLSPPNVTHFLILILSSLHPGTT